ncbi:MAG: gliding motility-associated C-terminal domain-containing protein [Bacteroidia bacterium]|nr:gliding motility-associated C-terminal domain-containing protein [Bacteroidia bacterium]
MRHFLSLVFLFLSVFLFGQNNPVAHYSFDGCTLNDKAGNYNDAIVKNNLVCDCGVGQNSDAYYFNGSADTMYLDSDLGSLLSSDFSLGFYFWVNPASESYTIMSIRNGCNRDSSFIVQYLPFSREFIVEYSRNIAEGVFYRNELNLNQCWHHFMFTKQDEIFAIYIDGEFIESKEFLSALSVGDGYEFAVGYSPCVGITDQFFNGRIDEIKFYDYALLEDEINADLLYPDEIITQDTTIFLGEDVQVIAGSSCAQNINWFPTFGVDDPGSSTPLITPEETTLYALNFDHGNCSSVDSLLISVISPDDIECNQLLLPKAFTPNEDGLNDEYGISNDFIVDQIDRFEIYNRWGEKLFETINKNEKWDGTYKGEYQMPGTYVYKVEYTCLGNDYKSTGSFNILR